MNDKRKDLCIFSFSGAFVSGLVAPFAWLFLGVFLAMSYGGPGKSDALKSSFLYWLLTHPGCLLAGPRGGFLVMLISGFTWGIIFGALSGALLWFVLDFFTRDRSEKGPEIEGPEKETAPYFEQTKPPAPK